MQDEGLEDWIEVGQLRVGLFVQLDLHWTQHPFPFGSFLIRNPQQIEQIRSLGLARVRWSPKRSEVVPLPAGAEANANPVQHHAAPALPAEDKAAVERRALLVEQQASLARCERSYAESVKQFRQILQNVRAQPVEAREVAARQVATMVAEIDGKEDLALRLLSEKAGQESSLHPMNVCVLSILLARMLGHDDAELALVGQGALLHDIGKLELPDRLRWQNEYASAAERKLYQEHVAHGVALGRRMGLADGVLEIIAQHHEQADGGGYPERRRNQAIAPLARVVALVNRYDNLCNPSNPLSALTPHDALALLFARHRECFDDTVLAAFIRLLGVYPPGSVLLLNDGRHALVVAVNARRPLRPRIVIHDPGIDPAETLVVDLELHPELGINRALKPLQLPRAALVALSPRKRTCYYFERAGGGMAGR